ncbi:L-lactate dehydrogenase [Desulfitibacter alkalitolerans]|uniref:L-lactate dehydrogenase n=1 Tax=Desulfitibacter alkalitolerans TaxID=264641 RepID=UPI000A646716|nr:L-lactate dehydrogenase [Desulfitibacter alkalitolerans]
MYITKSKISIIGTGMVGSSIAYALMISGLTSRLVLVDIDEKRAQGEAMDLSHSASFIKPIKITAGDYADCKGSQIVIIAAGANQKPGETRLELTNRNVEVLNSIIKPLSKHCPDSIVLLVSNPVDILTYVTHKSGYFKNGRVIGSGTVLDTSRFRYLIGQHCQVDPRSVHAYVLGEHGDSEVLTWSSASIGGMKLLDFCRLAPGANENWKKDIDYKVRKAAYEIITRKGSTYYAIGMATKRIVEAILRNEKSVLTVSAMINNAYGISDVCLSLPTIVGSRGIIRTFEPKLSTEEITELQRSADTLKKYLKNL